MAFPDSREDFVWLVEQMRGLGVSGAFGVTLGPPPRRADELEAAARRAKSPLEQESLNKERAEALRLARVQEARDHMRNLLAANGRTYTDRELDQMVGPVE